MTPSYELGLRYELACQLIGERMSVISGELFRQRNKEWPVEESINDLKARVSSLFLEREQLRSDDEWAIRSIIDRYSSGYPGRPR